MSPARMFSAAVVDDGLRWSLDVEGRLSITGRRSVVEPLVPFKAELQRLMRCESCAEPASAIVAPDDDRPLPLCLGCWLWLDRHGGSSGPYVPGVDVYAWPPSIRAPAPAPARDDGASR